MNLVCIRKESSKVSAVHLYLGYYVPPLQPLERTYSFLQMWLELFSCHYK